MRRPAHRPGHTAASGWAHPYLGPAALAVFYNDGGDPPNPTPADVPPKRTTPTPVDDGDQVVMPQEKFTQNMTEQRRRGRHAAYREIAEAAGIDFDVNTFDPKAFAESFKEAQAARKAMLTEEQRRAEELAQKEQAIASREAETAKRDAETAKARRDLQLEMALVRLGAVDLEDQPNLQDAFAMLERDLAATPDAEADAIAAAATKLKQRRPELFGAAPAPQPNTLPPAPGGAPAGGPPARTTPSKDDVKARAHARAVKMGYARKPDAA
ncbi:hypothetical protein [Streptomyces sp. NPDC007991]|uniref:hypothetical protein n=1 Tax=Streptomyces sp. NPDC007991 TaxID=3364803 RepID=UPI0036E41408